MDPSVVLGDDAYIVLNDTLAQVCPALVRLGIRGLIGVGVEDVGAAQVGSKDFGHFGPTHKFVDCEETEQPGIEGNLRVACVFIDAMQEVRLFIVVGGEDYVVYNSLESLVEVS